jgi:mannitol-1-phosphate 5-dehydrogenase
MKLVQFGAGNIGRSFIGQIFARAFWEVVFIDIDSDIIDALNRRRSYTVEVKDRIHKTIVVENVRGVSALDTGKVHDEISEADIVATSVGQQALPHIMKPIAQGLIKRRKLFSDRPLDIIICENMQNAASFFKTALKKELPEDFPFDNSVGLVETSIGKMVPIMGDREKKSDPLLVYAEAYNTLIVDKMGFKGPIPDIDELDPKDNIDAFVDRKLFIHNLGHAILSYTAFVFKKEYRYIWEAAFDSDISAVTEKAMWESGKALIKEYPAEFDEKGIGEHIYDLLSRFRNRALGDTIYRVGRDLYRKLAPNDRLIGALKLCEKNGIEAKNISFGIAASLFFKAVDENGKMYENDLLFHEKELTRGVEQVLKDICELDQRPSSLILKYYDLIVSGATLDSLAHLED